MRLEGKGMGLTIDIVTGIRKEQEKVDIQLLFLCGPSGVGKSTIQEALMQTSDRVTTLHAFTDRPPRQNERKICISPEEFFRMESGGKFILTHQMFGHRYGNTYEAVEEALRSGKKIILDYPLFYLHDALSRIVIPNSVVYILPPSLDDLQNRLAARPGRFEDALREIELLTNPEYHQLINHFLINDNLPHILIELGQLLFPNKNIK